MRRLLLAATLPLLAVGCTRTDQAADVAVTKPAATAATALAYPAATRGDTVDTYHGQSVADPYRWMENLDSPELARWIDEQNRLTQSFIGAAGNRDAIAERLRALFDHERYGVPVARGDRYFYTRNDGLQNQSPVYWQQGLDGEPRLLIDPNTLSEDGTIALAEWQVSDDGRLIAYALSDGGSDWRTIRVRDVETGQDLPDEIRWAKFTQIAWLPDSGGFYYSRYDAPAEGEDELKSVNRFQKLYFHRLGTPQSEDRLVYERPDQPEWGFSAEVSDDGQLLLISVWRGTEERNLLFTKDLTTPNAPVRELVSDFTHAYDVVGAIDNTVYVRTDDGAERYRVIAIDLARPERDAWREVIPEASGTLTGANLVGAALVAECLEDAKSRFEAWKLGGERIAEVPLPGIGTAAGFGGSAHSTESFFAFTGFTTPGEIWRWDPATNAVSLFRKPKLAFDPEAFETRQVFYTASDGVRIPMFITARRGVALDGNNPTILYGYGGFNIPVTPTFNPATIAWLEMGGVYAVANIRGGGEYGRAWHEAALREKRPRAFDDFAEAAEYLIAERWTRPERLAISGRSNGGLLVAATMLRRPELFAAALPAVGVLDMLRFRDFTIGWAWESDYGSVKDADGFAVLKGYSPLHNVQPGVEYPAVLVLTADRDDRVFPAHSFKFAAEMQHTATSSRPILIRIETRAGHGAGKPTGKIIEENADVFAFLSRTLGMGPVTPTATTPAASSAP
jgi:prolyl oligopeptidase